MSNVDVISSESGLQQIITPVQLALSEPLSVAIEHRTNHISTSMTKFYAETRHETRHESDSEMEFHN